MTRVRPVRVSSSTTSYALRGLAATPMTRSPCTARVDAHSVQGPAASTSSPVSGSSSPRAVVPLPWMTAISPFSSGWNHLRPIFHSGPPNSSPRPGHRPVPGTKPGPAPGSSASGRTLCSSHQLLTSETKRSEPSGAQSTWHTDSSVSPTTGRTPPKGPSSLTSPSMTTVASQGICGWSQAIQAACRPSGESRGPVTKRCRSSQSSRTARRSIAAEPSRGTAAITRRTSVGPSPVNSSSTHQTSPRSGRSWGSAQRSPPPTGDRG